jgi:ribosome biogenesis protein Nip4
MIEPLRDFAKQFNASISLNEKLAVKERNRYFLLQPRLRGFVSDDFYYAGVYLGKTKEGRFFPSFIFLQMIGEGKANKVVVDDKTAWLFICGRDIFKKGIAEIHGSGKKGGYTLVMNRHGECLGFGRMQRDFSSAKKGVVIRNIADVGDFLRREKDQI